MKIILDSDNRKKGGDIISIAALGSILRKFRTKDEHYLRIKTVWLECIERVEEEAIGSNYQHREMKRTFEFPFEEIYEKKFVVKEK